MHKLTPCSGCQRHVRSSESACPFCRQPLTAPAVTDDVLPGFVSRAAALALTATLAAATGCKRMETPQPPQHSATNPGEYNPPPSPTPVPMPQPVLRPNPNPSLAAAYGAPPPPRHPPVAPQVQKPDPNTPQAPPQTEAPVQRPNPWGSMATRYGAPPRPPSGSDPGL